MDSLHQLRALFSFQGAQDLIAAFGYLLLFAIIFAETGLLIGFFLPGDSLLFAAGAFVALHPEKMNIAVLMLLLVVAAIAGDATGFMIGRRFGPRLFSRPNSRFFKREHLERTHAFYEKHGSKTIVLARFVPIVRTFAPTVAGAAGMGYRTFALFNVLGGVGWIASMTLLGYALGRNPWMQKNFEKGVLLIVALSLLPIVIHALAERRAKKQDIL